MNARSLIQNMFQRLGWDVRRVGYPSSEELLLARFLTVTRPTVVFDVGANVGQYGMSLRKCGFAGRIVSFEAIASVHARLAAVAAQDGNWTVAPRCALGRTPGKACINVAANSVSSSLLSMNDLHVDAAPASRYVTSETVPVRRLDDVAETRLDKSAKLLLKIDTQGYEEEVLAGASRVLDSVIAMQLELSLMPLYKGAPTLRRMLELCEDLGFELYGLIPGFYDEKTARLLQMDGLFVKITPPSASDR